MASFTNRHEAYTRDTERLAYWVALTYELIPDKPKQNKPKQNQPSAKTKTKHHMTVHEFSRRVGVIADHNLKTRVDIPPCIFRLFQSVIKDRKETGRFFELFNAENPDPKVEASNRSHKFFIEYLEGCFDRLGGQDWRASQGDPSQGSQRQCAGDDVEDEIKQSVHKNKNMFSILQTRDDQTETESESPRSSSEPPTTQNNLAKIEKEHKSSGSRFEHVSPKRYGIVDEEGGIDMKYQMATIALFQEFHHLRYYLVSIWEAVAEDKFNIAIAGAMSNTAIATLKRSWMVVSRRFPENDSYEDFLEVMVPGVDPTKDTDDKPLLSSGDDDQEKLQADLKDLDLKEFLLLYAYQDFIAFVKDFKINHDGSQSKRFKRLRRTWDPNLDFRKTPVPDKMQQREWRRTYTITWLYDLVNVFSYLCEEIHSPNGAEWDPKKADWSFVGGRDGSRHLFGLDEFARFACFLAWKTKITECRNYIKPHHILQLQIIVDSMSVSRGWSEKLITSQIQSPVEHAQDSIPRRDLKRFLHCDRDDINPIHNYLSSSEELGSRLRICKKTHGGFRYSHHADIFQTQNDRFRKSLGYPKHKSGESGESDLIKLETRKRLWEHSPCLCGLGLMEALEIAFGMGTLLWNQIPEPVLAVHLHNMLVREGYIDRPASLYSTLEKSFTGVFFSESTIPDSDFAKALSNQIRRISASGSTALHRKFGLPKSADILEILDEGRARNKFVSMTTNTTLHRLANWDSIPGRRIAVPSPLARLRLCGAKQIVKIVNEKTQGTTEVVNEKTEEIKKTVNEFDRSDLNSMGLVKRWLRTRDGDGKYLSESKLIEVVNEVRETFRSRRNNTIPDALSEDMKLCLQATHGDNPLVILVGDELETVKDDLVEGFVHGPPFFTLDYTSITLEFFKLFEKIETRLKELRNPVYMGVFEKPQSKWQPPRKTGPPRIALVNDAMCKGNVQCLEVMAEELQNSRRELKDFWYF